MAFAPSSIIYLCGVPFDNSYKHQVYFDSYAEQSRYFIERSIDQGAVSEYLTVRKTLPNGRVRDSIKIARNIEQLATVNYLMYNNANHGNKWFYAFITEYIYINENTTELVFETDVWQTWMFDITILKSYVVREHSLTDNIGDNIVPEQFTAEDYVYDHVPYDITEEHFDLDSWGYLIATSSPIVTEGTRGTTMSGIYQGLYFHYFESVNDVNTFLGKAEEVENDCVQFITLIPNFCCANATDTNGQLDQTTTPNSWSGTLSVSEAYRNFEKYYPVNKKLFTSPYFNMVVSNHNGQEAVYNLEEFDVWGSPKFRMYGDISASPSMVMIPLNYKGCEENYDFGITLSGFPQCSFNNDTYKLWLAKNQFSNGVSLWSNAGKVVAGIGAIATGAVLTGGTMGIGAGGGIGLATTGAYTAASGVSGILNTISSYKAAEQEPNKVNQGNARNNLLTACGHNKFDVYIRTIRKHYARAIDDFFTMYGYQTNQLKEPNISSRPYFNYTQTTDANIVGPIPNEDLARIKRMFNEGVTFWKSTSIIGNYSVDNSPS